MKRRQPKPKAKADLGQFSGLGKFLIATVITLWAMSLLPKETQELIFGRKENDDERSFAE